MSVLPKKGGGPAGAAHSAPCVDEADSQDDGRVHSQTETQSGNEAGNDTCLRRIGDLAIDNEKKDQEPSQNGPPPEGLLYTLPHLGLKELLVLEAVNKQLRDAVRGDILLWQRLHVDAPLNKKFTNDALLRLAGRAQGRLQSLDLVKCLRISEEAIATVLASNLTLQKLSLPGCTRVNAEAILRLVKAQTERRRSSETPGLTQLRIQGLYGVTGAILDDLQTMLRSNGNPELQPADASPQYYKNGGLSPAACNEERAIDVEACPKCGDFRLVFDCTRETCRQRRGVPLQQCRGCYLCIARCEECGTCIEGDGDDEAGETFCPEKLCSSCWLRQPKCSDCNRAGCSRHAADYVRRSEGGNFTCDECQQTSLREAGSEDEFF